MAAKPYMPFYVADYMADAAHLTTLEHGAYLLMIMTYWQTGKPLPDDDKKLCEITKLNFTNYKKIKAHLKEFFLCENGKMTHKRIEKELEEFKKKSDIRRLAGQKSGESRRAKKTNTCSTHVQHMLNKCPTSVEHMLNYTDTDTYTDTDSNTETLKKIEDKTTPPTPSPSVRGKFPKKDEDIKTIFEHWQKIMRHNEANLTVDRRKAISKGLAMGYTKEQLCEAITGCSLSGFHMGENPGGVTYDRLGLIFKSADNIDKFMGYVKNPPKKQNKTQKIFSENLSISQSWAERKKKESANE